MERDPDPGLKDIKPKTQPRATVARRVDRRGNVTGRPRHCGNWGKVFARRASSAAIFPRTGEGPNAAGPPFDDERRETVRATD